MDDAFYTHARLYGLMFPGGGPAVDFYRAEAGRTSSPTSSSHRFGDWSSGPFSADAPLQLCVCESA